MADEFKCQCGKVLPLAEEELCVSCNVSLCTECFNRNGGLCDRCQKEEDDDDLWLEENLGEEEDDDWDEEEDEDLPY